MERELEISVKIIYRDKGGGSMNQNQINESYKLFNIPEQIVPQYTNAEEFSRNIKECSVLRDVDVCYTSNSLPLDGGQYKQK